VGAGARRAGSPGGPLSENWAERRRLAYAAAGTGGPLFFRRIVADRPADGAFIDRIVDDALARRLR
jgi:hypothetical protein